MAAASASSTTEFEIASTGKFSCDALLANLKAMEGALEPNVEWKPFTTVCAEMAKLVATMGSVFGFAASDVTHNVGVMCKRYKEFAALSAAEGEPSSSTIEFALEREAKAGNAKQNDGKYVAVTFTARHLLWTLDFVHAILSKLTTDDATIAAKELCEMTRDAYTETLRQYHGWMLAGTISTACGMLPYKKVFLETLASGETADDVKAKLKDAVARMGKCKEVVWELYRKRSIVKETD
jgi:hypothetical protein